MWFERRLVYEAPARFIETKRICIRDQLVVPIPAQELELRIHRDRLQDQRKSLMQSRMSDSKNHSTMC